MRELKWMYLFDKMHVHFHIHKCIHAKSRQNKQLIIILFIHSTRPLLCQSIKIQLSMYFFLLLRLLLLLSQTIHDSQFFSCRLLIRFALFSIFCFFFFPFVCIFLFILFSFIVCTTMFSCVLLSLLRNAFGITICVSTKQNMFRLGMMDTTYENIPPTTKQQCIRIRSAILRH